ncbi:MAG: hypothetical protein IPJ78_13165 [Gemmatimonadetes bacterium]|jgi:hypothetical protein|nr:hypothetical protein [Gemmatimonadota bacterium]MBP7549685.1 hypothetical protein [Gemmatimonadaceae bacterium]
MRRVATVASLLLAPALLAAQDDSSSVQGSIYRRPFIAEAGRTAVGGYVEANAHFAREQGIGPGLSMELRRFNLFLFSSLGPRLRFISELEFEHGTQEIALETALIDYRVSSALVLRGGILLPPIGAFNQNHDGPRWEFVARPLVSTEIIPSTLSEVGFGVNGRLAPAGLTLTYDAYLTNGLGEGVVLNPTGRTHLASGKRAGQFAGDDNGVPALSGRLALRAPKVGEAGISWYGTTYNTFRVDGMAVDARRDLAITAVDLAASLPRGITLRGEAALARVDLPDGLTDLLGSRQWGIHLDLVAPVWRAERGVLRGSILSVTTRLEHVDRNVGRFDATGQLIGDDLGAIVLGASLRPAAGTVLKVNLRREWSHDLLRNAASRRAALQFGIASYF